MSETVFRTCNICEAMCGLKFEVENNRVLSVLPDEDDVFSKGYICPKGAAIAEVYGDPDRLKTPVRRTPAGDFEPISWKEAFDLVENKLRATRAQYGPDSIGMYMGNPSVHNYGAIALTVAFNRAIGSRNITNAGSQDTNPRFAASYYLYGQSINVPIPDVDRTDYFLCLGANPRVSNGSFVGAPDMRRRLRAIRERGGKVVVVDPRRTETAREASEFVSIRPGGDAAFLFAMLETLVTEGRVDRAAIDRVAKGWDEIETRLAQFRPERVATHVGIETETIRRLAREFAAAKTAVAYTRVGVCNNAHGTVASYAADLLNVACGRLGAAGGAMFATPLVDVTPILQWTKGDGHNRWRSRVRGLPETLGAIPAATLAEEMETPGEGQVRAFLTFAGNPVLSTPNGRRLERALEKLDFMVSIDPMINETTRHADVILPPASGLAEDHIDLFVARFAVRNIARWSPPVVAKVAGELFDWEILLELIYRLGGGPNGMPALDWIYRLGRRLGLRWTPQSTANLLIRTGPHGDKFLPWRKGLSLEKVKGHPHGIDLGPMEPGLKHAVLHKDGKVHLAAGPILRAVDELSDELARPVEADALLLIGRRELRSNNSWLHNAPSLVAGKERCVLYVHPDDATRLGLADGRSATMSSRTHTADVPVHITEEIRPGVVSLPHGYGHRSSARWQRTAGEHAGVSINDWTDDALVESVVGQSILNGVPVRLSAVEPGGERSSSELEAAGAVSS